MFVEGLILLSTCAGVSLTSGVPSLLTSVFVGVGISVLILGMYLSIKALKLPYKMVHDVLRVLRRVAQRVLFFSWLIVTTFFVMWLASETVQSHLRPLLFVDMLTLPTSDTESVWYGWSYSVTLVWTIALLFVCFIATICLSQVKGIDTDESLRKEDREEKKTGLDRTGRLLRSLRTYSGLVIVILWYWTDQHLVVRNAVCSNSNRTQMFAAYNSTPNCSLDVYLTSLHSSTNTSTSQTTNQTSTNSQSRATMAFSWASWKGYLVLFLAIMVADTVGVYWIHNPLLSTSKSGPFGVLGATMVLAIPEWLSRLYQCCGFICILAPPSAFMLTLGRQVLRGDRWVLWWASGVCWFWLANYMLLSLLQVRMQWQSHKAAKPQPPASASEPITSPLPTDSTDAAASAQLGFPSQTGQTPPAGTGEPYEAIWKQSRYMGTIQRKMGLPWTQRPLLFTTDTAMSQYPGDGARYMPPMHTGYAGGYADAHSYVAMQPQHGEIAFKKDR